MTLLQQLETLTPVAAGGFSELFLIDGKAVKVLEDQCYTDILEECYKQNLAAEAGLAPKVHSVAKLTEDKIVIVMDMIDTDRFYHADGDDGIAPTLLGELDDYQQELGVELYCKMILAGIIHADYHTGNWFLSDEGDTLAIDFGIASELQRAPLKHLTRAVQFLLPCIPHAQAAMLMEAFQNGPEATREALVQVAQMNV